MHKSKVVIGTMSTLLRENLSLGGKTFACNFTNTNIFDFPIKGLCFSKTLIIKILKNNYQKYIKFLKKYHEQLKKKIMFVKIDLTKLLNLLIND